MQNRLIASVLGCGLVLLSACATPKPTPIEITASPIEKPELVLPSANVLDLRDTDWIVITPDNVDGVMASLPADNTALFALTDKGYENLSLNVNDIRTYITQLQAIIVAYEGYYKSSNMAIDAANEKIRSGSK